MTNKDFILHGLSFVVFIGFCMFSLCLFFASLIWPPCYFSLQGGDQVEEQEDVTSTEAESQEACAVYLLADRHDTDIYQLVCGWVIEMCIYYISHTWHPMGCSDWYVLLIHLGIIFRNNTWYQKKSRLKKANITVAILDDSQQRKGPGDCSIHRSPLRGDWGSGKVSIQGKFQDVFVKEILSAFKMGTRYA